MLLNHALHRTRAHRRIIALLYQPNTSFFVYIDDHLPFIELRLQLSQELICNGQNDIFSQRTKRYDRIESVPEFRREGSVNRLKGICGVILHRKSD